jgi:hypothetical protein
MTFPQVAKMNEKGGENETFVKEVNHSGTLWLRGLPAAGKTTLANILHKKLKELGEFKFEKRLVFRINSGSLLKIMLYTI